MLLGGTLELPWPELPFGRDTVYALRNPVLVVAFFCGGRNLAFGAGGREGALGVAGARDYEAPASKALLRLLEAA
jgi:hypothetical protein